MVMDPSLAQPVTPGSLTYAGADVATKNLCDLHQLVCSYKNTWLENQVFILPNELWMAYVDDSRGEKNEAEQIRTF